MTLQDLKIDSSWTLFLDRDGVINQRLAGDYVKKWEELGFLPGVIDALGIFSLIFGRIFVVSNQQGVGKGLMTAGDVEEIHKKMVEEITRGGGRIDAIYFAPQLASERSIMRKPGIGMALKARKKFPETRFRKSLMIGDSLSDMIFGKRAGMKTVLVAHDGKLSGKHPHLVDFLFPDLHSVALTFQPQPQSQNLIS